MGQSTVLIVEDDLDVSETLALVLGDEGYETALAMNGAEALELLRNGLGPCLIVLDLMMPVMDGYAFRAEQQKDPTLATIPTVILSAAQGLAAEAKKLDVDEYLAKPVRLDALLEVLKRSCRKD